MKLNKKIFVVTPMMMALSLAMSPSYAQDDEDRPAAQRGQDSAAQQTQGAQGARQGAQGAQQGQAGAQQGQSTAQRNQGGGAQTAAAKLTDGQILQVVRTLNDAEIKQADEAIDQSENDQVKQVAEMIKMDHEAANEQVDDLLDGALNLDDSPLNETLAEQGEDTHEKLQDLEGAQYDCQYLSAQVAQHQAALDTAKTQLTPNAQNAAVKQFLTAITPKLENHMKMAKDAMGKAEGCDQSSLTTRP
ncbi:MAG: hypothetical protein RLZZ227_113 [Pseudomonadota bacterium]|jgi:putative membrane protein